MIKKLIYDVRDAYAEIGSGHRCYMTRLSDRKEETLNTQEITVREICLKIDELVDAVNKITGEKNDKN